MPFIINYPIHCLYCKSSADEGPIVELNLHFRPISNAHEIKSQDKTRNQKCRVPHPPIPSPSSPLRIANKAAHKVLLSRTNSKHRRQTRPSLSSLESGIHLAYLFRLFLIDLKVRNCSHHVKWRIFVCCVCFCPLEGRSGRKEREVSG